MGIEPAPAPEKEDYKVKPHKVKIVSSNATGYSMAAVCEYCGKCTFYANNTSKYTGESMGDCPNSPSYEAVIGRELISMVQRIGNSSNGRTEKE